MNDIPAFPAILYIAGQQIHAVGMTLRDYFAAKALQGFLSSSRPIKNLAVGERATLEDYVKRSYEIADEMLRARETK